ncbi:type 3 dihydrofolate reductase [Corallincola luteus]|uniref:Dihydrofolate reductase n=1 Tax=Corallincola luteus TaxID=1775177 RepID=A0ABY2AL39_9GAMM|nr:type 3 dihydrofolate reductase [Corallincola luteus]TCI03642.1 type 3 dihydrofolate reductase [Corallincola luteus]
MMISLVAAMANGRVIGRDNKMPWHLPADLKHFKATTLGKPVVMGRKTFESIGRPLPGRQNIVITRDAQWHADGVTVVHGVEQALVAAGPVEELMVIGGGNIYQQLLPRAERLYLTFIELDTQGDAWFPDYQPELWREIDSVAHQPDEKNPYHYRFVTLVRK